jgi:hypothetical protein
MPSVPKATKCQTLGCANQQTYRSSYCSEHGGGITDKGKANGKLYKSKGWQIRRDMQLSAYPLCARCLLDNKVVPAIVVDHVFPHRQDSLKFRYNLYQSLCAPCHTIKGQDERKGSYRYYVKDTVFNDSDYAMVIAEKTWE